MTRPLRRALPAALPAALLVLGLVAGGCADGASDPDAAPTGSASGSASASASGSAPAEPEQPMTYVALGDSYTAAPLVPSTDPADPCLRSSQNYPTLAAAALGYELTDVSCAGADSAAMIGVQQIGSEVNLPQFDSLGAETDLVTVGLGGNDFGLFEALLRDCASSSDVNAEGSPCTDAVAGGTAEDLTETLPKVADRIEAVLGGIRDRAPDAQVIAIGYPMLLPEDGSCPGLGIASGDYDYVRQLNQGLNDAVAEAAERTGDGFVDVYAASAGHDLCSDEPWVNGPQTDPQAALAFHPFAAEQAAVADLVVEQVRAGAGAGGTAS